MPGESLLWFLYHYVARLGCLEGRPGLIASRIRVDYIAAVRAKVYELRRAGRVMDDAPMQGQQIGEGVL